jgi:hypothetical protein
MELLCNRWARGGYSDVRHVGSCNVAGDRYLILGEGTRRYECDIGIDPREFTGLNPSK